MQNNLEKQKSFRIFIMLNKKKPNKKTMKKVLNTTGLFLMNSFLTALGIFVACAIVYSFYLGITV